ncbi:hypothetical protein V5T82_14490 [Magnetovibrio sp. PR-2]|uniref:hypothetical protein n=1 Tax=Magnetovibrio sp. PR-2 TaxID=3120356 RepID=UPI002FCE2BEA
MPLDVRKLIFSQQELKLAFHTYAKEQNLNVSASQVDSFNILDPENMAGTTDSSTGFKAVLNYQSKAPSNVYRLNLNEQQILEAMINMCRGLNIPLPRKGQKYLQQHKGSLALTIGLNEKDIREYMAVTNDTAPAAAPAPAPELAQDAKPAAKVARRD